MIDMYIYGASGHGKVVLDAARNAGVSVTGFVDDNPTLTVFQGLPVLKKLPAMSSFVIAIGDNAIRKNIHLAHHDFSPLNIYHPSTIISASAVMGIGTFAAANTVINANAIIGNSCIINTGAVVEHDCVVGNYVHISPNATICGNVHIGNGTHVGAGAIVIPGVNIGKWVTIGAGAVVIKDIPDNVTVVGNPARIINS